MRVHEFTPKTDFDVAWVAFVEELQRRTGKQFYFDELTGSRKDFLLHLAERSHYIRVSEHPVWYGKVLLTMGNDEKVAGNVVKKVNWPKVEAFVKRHDRKKR